MASALSLSRRRFVTFTALPLAAAALLLVATAAAAAVQAARLRDVAPAERATVAQGISEASLARAERLLSSPLPPRVDADAPSFRPVFAASVSGPDLPLGALAAEGEAAAATGGQGDAAAAAPLALEPAALLLQPSASSPVVPRPRVGGWRGAFIAAMGEAARTAPYAERIPASVTIAQAIVESDWGQSELARGAHNYFGIKASTRSGPAGAVTLPTIEYVGGQAYRVDQPFRAYHGMAESVADHHRFLLENPRYRVALAQGRDPEAFARALQRAGYATDPWYAAKLLALMDQFDLYRYDAR